MLITIVHEKILFNKNEDELKKMKCALFQLNNDKLWLVVNYIMQHWIQNISNYFEFGFKQFERHFGRNIFVELVDDRWAALKLESEYRLAEI